MVVRSSRYPPDNLHTDWQSPLSVRAVFGIVVAGRPFSVAMPAHAIWSLVGDFAVIDFKLAGSAAERDRAGKAKARHRRTQHDIDLPEQV